MLRSKNQHKNDNICEKTVISNRKYLLVYFIFLTTDNGNFEQQQIFYIPSEFKSKLQT